MTLTDFFLIWLNSYIVHSPAAVDASAVLETPSGNTEFAMIYTCIVNKSEQSRDGSECSTLIEIAARTSLVYTI